LIFNQKLRRLLKTASNVVAVLLLIKGSYMSTCIFTCITQKVRCGTNLEWWSKYLSWCHQWLI